MARRRPRHRPTGNFTLVQDPDNERGLAVRRVTPEERKGVALRGGYLFVTEVEATGFANAERLSRGGTATFSRKRVDGCRVYVGRGRRSVGFGYGGYFGGGIDTGGGIDSGGIDSGGAQ